MSFEKPQKGNPHRITVNQHVFPRASIARFANDNNCVSVFYIPTGKTFIAGPDNGLFCAKRVWDQRAEEGYMQRIERDFQKLVEDIILNKIYFIEYAEKSIVNSFFALWNIRAHNKLNPIPDQKINGIVGLERNLTKNEQELLEKNHISFIRPDFTMPGRSTAGINIQMNVDRAVMELQNARWGILRAKKGEFLVPDNFSNARIVPISPTICLFSQSENAVISEKEVAELNQLAIESSNEYFFARDLSKCPRELHALPSSNLDLMMENWATRQYKLLEIS